MATISIKCPNCGGGLQFDPAAQDYQCEYCLSHFTQEELERIAPEAKAEAERLKAENYDLQNKVLAARNRGNAQGDAADGEGSCEE